MDSGRSERALLRPAGALLLALLASSAHAKDAPTTIAADAKAKQWSVADYPKTKPIEGLEIRGEGCWRRLYLAGRLVCDGLVRTVDSRCSKVLVPEPRADDRSKRSGVQWLFGSRCQPTVWYPLFKSIRSEGPFLSGSLGFGVFFLEDAKGAVEIACVPSAMAHFSYWKERIEACVSTFGGP